MPDNAIIQSAVLKVKQSGLPISTNPFSILAVLLTDIHQGPFSANAALQLADFNAPPSGLKGGVFNKIPVAGWYIDTLNATGRSQVNRVGLTQLRLRFTKDDNNNFASNLMRFVSRNGSTSLRPFLVITYTLP